MEIRTARDTSNIHSGEAIHWCRKVAETGDIDAITELGTMLSWARDPIAEAEGRQWLDFAIAAGHVPAMYGLAGALRWRHDPEAEVWYLRAAEGGHAIAMANVAAVYADSGRASEAESWYRRAIDAGHTDSAMSLIVLLEQNGRAAEVPEWMDWARQHVADRDIIRYSYLLSRRGTDHVAEAWLEHYAELGNAEAMAQLADSYSRDPQRAAETERWYRAAIEAGELRVTWQFTSWLEEQGRPDDAEYWREFADRSGLERPTLNSVGNVLTIGLTIVTTSAVVPFVSAIAQEAGKNTYERIKKHFTRTKDHEVSEALDDSKVITIIVRDPELPVEVEIRRDLPSVAIDRLENLAIDDSPSRYVWNPITQSWQAD